MEPWKLIAEAQRRADIKIIRDRMLTLNHRDTLGCPCCETAHDLIKAIRDAPRISSRSEDGVVITVYEAGK